MKIIDLYKKHSTVLSFEVFPPKKDGGLDSLYSTIDKLSDLSPDYISVTCGAGGSVSELDATLAIADYIKKHSGAVSLAHLTCGQLKAKELEKTIEALKNKKIKNVLALRGDTVARNSDFKYAKDLISMLKKHDFCIGAAAYPEGHILSSDASGHVSSCISDSEVDHLAQKQEAGADFFITQLFFQNDIFYRFIDRILARGVRLPVSAGVMPLLSKAQVERMIFLCAASLPAPIIKIINKYGDNPTDLEKAGLEYAFNQVQNLCANKVGGVHIYCMNRPHIAEFITKDLKVSRA